MANQWELLARGKSKDSLEKEAATLDYQFHQGDWGCLQIYFPISLPWDFSEKVKSYAVARGLQDVSVIRQTGYCYAITYRCRSPEWLTILVACIGAAIVICGIGWVITKWLVYKARAEAIKAQSDASIDQQKKILDQTLSTITQIPDKDQRLSTYKALLGDVTKSSPGYQASVPSSGTSGLPTLPTWSWGVIAVLVIMAVVAALYAFKR